MNEKQFVINSFRKNFIQFSQEKIIIYGLGRNTKAILDVCEEFNIVGLMDGLRTGETVWGYPVITCEQAAVMGVKTIVIVATSANVPVIYRRIAKQCDELEIDVYDINGALQRQIEKEYTLPILYKEMKRDSLIQKIDSCDVVSFDIFDTLLVRNTLYPTDVFENMQNKYTEFLPKGYNFADCRMKAEQDLYLSANPTIYEIYQRMVGDYSFPVDITKQMIALEIAEELDTLHPRNSIIGILDYALSKGKIICCTSDMYLPKDVLSNILGSKGITGITDIFVSCDYRTAKCDGLFQTVKEHFAGKRILHIGDNREADIVSAKRYGIDETFEIASIYNMALASRFSFVLESVDSLADRNALGRFLSEQLNDPFLFHKTDGRLLICDEYSMGYFYVEPIMSIFVHWLLEHAKVDHIDCVLLGSRDGWLIREMLDIFKEKEDVGFEYKYFYTSREACTAAGIKNEKDIQYAASIPFDGTTEELLGKRFFVPPCEVKARCDKEDIEYLLIHHDVICSSAKEHREHYSTYISSCNIVGKTLGFVDFVSTGTCQFWLEKIMGTTLTGYYFSRILEDTKRHLKISSLIKPAYVYEGQEKLRKNYIFLENILTSPEPTLKGFDGRGNCIFGDEHRSQEQISQLLKIHDGIKDAFRDGLGEKRTISIEMAENMIELINAEYAVIDLEFVKNNPLIDEFCNRTFDLQVTLGMKH